MANCRSRYYVTVTRTTTSQVELEIIAPDLCEAEDIATDLVEDGGVADSEFTELDVDNVEIEGSYLDEQVDCDTDVGRE